MHSSYIRDSVQHHSLDNYYSTGGRLLQENPSMITNRDTADTMIKREIRSIQNAQNSYPKLPYRQNRYDPYQATQSTLPLNILGREAVDFLSKRKNQFGCPCDSDSKCLFCFKGDSDKYVKHEQVIADQILNDFQDHVDLSDPNAFSQLEYQNDQLEKVRLLQFYEENIHKLRRSYEKLMKGGLMQMKKYIIDMIDDFTAVNSNIFTEYLNYFQRRMTAMSVKLLNNDKMNVYTKEASAYLKYQSRIQCDEFIQFKDFFPDYLGCVDFVNDVSETKKRFLKDIRKDFSYGDPHLTVNSYQKLYKQSLDNLFNYKESLQQAIQRNEKNLQKFEHKEIVTRNVVDEKPVYNYDAQMNLLLPHEGEPIFEMGEATTKAQPFWKVNHLIQTSSIVTNHNSSDLINDFQLIDNSRYAITCSNDKSIKITNQISGDLKVSINVAHIDSILRLKLLSSGLLASAGKDGHIKLFETQLGQCQTTLTGHTDWVWGLDEIPGECLVSCSDDKTMKFWSIDNKICYKTVISPQNRGIRCMKVISIKRLAFASYRIWIYNTLRDDIEKHFVGHTNYVRAINFNSKRNYLLSGSEDGTIRWWGYDSCENIKAISTDCAVICLDIWEDDYIISGNSDSTIRFWDLSLKRLVCKKDTKIFPTQIRVTDDQRIVYAEYNNQIILKNPQL